MSNSMQTIDMVNLINDLYSGFDWLADLYGMERIRTEGNHCMAASGAPSPNDDHAMLASRMALEIGKVTAKFNKRNNVNIHFRVGISSGSCRGGIIGRKQFMYYTWGTTVDEARTVQKYGELDQVTVSASTFAEIQTKCAVGPLIDVHEAMVFKLESIREEFKQ